MLIAFVSHVIGAGLIYGILHLREAIRAGNTDPRLPAAIDTLYNAWVTAKTILHFLH